MFCLSGGGHVDHEDCAVHLADVISCTSWYTVSPSWSLRVLCKTLHMNFNFGNSLAKILSSGVLGMRLLGLRFAVTQEIADLMAGSFVLAIFQSS